jgi:hypothetical protein
MSDELMRYMDGERRPARRDREVAAKAKPIHDEVRLAAFKADGAMALAGHIMEGVVGLDQHRRTLAANDPITNQLLADIEQQAIFSVKKIQSNLYNDWGL